MHGGEFRSLLIDRRESHLPLGSPLRLSALKALDPRDLLRAGERALSLGLDVVGIWHTHPDHPARPSETDRARAWEAWIYLIVPVRKGDVGEPRAWRLNGSGFVEKKLKS